MGPRQQLEAGLPPLPPSLFPLRSSFPEGWQHTIGMAVPISISQPTKGSSPSERAISPAPEEKQLVQAACSVSIALQSAKAA